MKWLFIGAQYCVPHHLLSRLTGVFAQCRLRLVKNLMIRRFIRRYGVDMSEAQGQNPEDYSSFNAFFTRALLADARPIAAAASAIISPADGAISAAGDISADRLIQAKGRDYSLQALLGGDSRHAEQFRDGSFATVYLAPRDYHRVHMPANGELQEMIYVPGRLFSVNQTTSENIPDLFARNERAICLFSTPQGPMAVILVGAMIVAGIETVWSGQVCPTRQQRYREDYSTRQPPVYLEKGAELGRFMLGSTVIVLFGPGMARWSETLQPQTRLSMGEEIGRFTALSSD